MLPETNNATLSFVETGKGKKHLYSYIILVVLKKHGLKL
jgi:hypothetical protein